MNTIYSLLASTLSAVVVPHILALRQVISLLNCAADYSVSAVEFISRVRDTHI